MTIGTRALYLAMRTVGLVACALPRKIALAIASGFARLVWRVYRITPQREFVPTNIRSAWPELSGAQAAALGENSLVSLTRAIAELMRFPIFKREAAAIVRVEGREHLDAALAAGRGAIVVTAHFGNWELLGATLARQFGPVSALVQTPSQDAFARLFIEYRHLVGVETYSNSGPQSIRPALRALRAGEILALLCDQHGPAREAAGSLLGQRVWVPLGPFTFARRTGSAIIPARIVRKEDHTHRLILEPALPIAADADANAQALLDRYGAWIAQDPDHWLWVHNRWEFRADDPVRPRQEALPGRLLSVLIALFLALWVRPATAQLLERPLIVAYPDRLEVVDTLHPDTHGAVPLPGPAEAALCLPGRDLLVVHIPSQQEVALVDLQPFSPTRFQVLRTFRAPELGAFDVGFEEVAGRVLLGFGKTVIAHFGEKRWDFEIGFDRPDEIPYPFSTGTTLYLPAGVFVLHQGELAFEDTQRDPQGSAADERPIALARRPTALLADAAGQLLYVAERGADDHGSLARIDARDQTVLGQSPTPAGISSLAWLDGRTLAVLAGDRIGVFDVTTHAFTRWIQLRLPGGPPQRLFPAS